MDRIEPRIYVGTYGKYNNGSIAGAWLSLDEHDTEALFYAAAKELHKNEHDPEFMFQDCEGFPRELYGESHLDERLWEWLELGHGNREIVTAWLEVNGGTDSFGYIKDTYVGHWESWDEYVSDYIETTGLLERVPEEVLPYFDYESYGRDLSHDYSVADADSGGVHVFRNQ